MEHVGRGEGGIRHLLHLGQCQGRDRVLGVERVISAAGRISRQKHSRRDQGQGDHLDRGIARSMNASAEEVRQLRENDLRHRRARHPECPEVPAAADFRLHGEDRLCRQRAAAALGAADGMLDEHNIDPAPGSRIHPALQSLPAQRNGLLLGNIRHALETMHQVTIDDGIVRRAPRGRTDAGGNDSHSRYQRRAWRHHRRRSRRIDGCIGAGAAQPCCS